MLNTFHCAGAKKLEIEKHLVECYDETYGTGRSMVFKGLYKKTIDKPMNVAVKKIHKHEFSLRELNSLVDAQHENVIKLFGYFFEKSQYNLVFEPALCNLEEFLENEGEKYEELKKRISVKQVLFDVTKGLSYIHSEKFIHFDLKPENILLVDQGISSAKAVVADFGNTKQNKSFARSMTVSNVQIGTKVRISLENYKTIFTIFILNRGNHRKSFNFSTKIKKAAVLLIFLLK